MGRRSLDSTLMDLREGRISIDRFVRLVHDDIRRMADAFFERWRKNLPPGIEAVDIYQEMVCSSIAERRDLDWKPGQLNKKGKPISISVHWLWHMHTQAKRWIQEQRKSLRRSGKNPSRFPICMAFFREYEDVNGDYENEFDRLLISTENVDLTYNGEFDARAAQEVLLEAYDKLPIPMAVAWAVYVKEGDTESAAKRIDASPGLGSTCQASTIDEARVVVKQAVQKGRAIARAMTNNVAA